jgi:hypothetical protein
MIVSIFDANGELAMKISPLNVLNELSRADILTIPHRISPEGSTQPLLKIVAIPENKSNHRHPLF